MKKYVANIFPNPASTTIHIKGKNISSSTFSLFHYLDQVETLKIQIISNDHILIDINELKTGHYNIKFDSTIYLYPKRIIVKQ